MNPHLDADVTYTDDICKHTNVRVKPRPLWRKQNPTKNINSLIFPLFPSSSLFLVDSYCFSVGPHSQPSPKDFLRNDSRTQTNSVYLKFKSDDKAHSYHLGLFMRLYLI